jgi:hypothetical protein
MEMEEKVKVMEKFFSANLAAGCRVLDVVDALRLGVPHELHISEMLRQFAIAAECAVLVGQMDKQEIPEVIKEAAKWTAQDDSFGMR